MTDLKGMTLGEALSLFTPGCILVCKSVFEPHKILPYVVELIMVHP